MANETINVPQAPSAMPDGLQKKWTATYASAFKEAKADDENASDGDCHQAARKEANRLLRVDEVKSYKDAMSLPDWQYVQREEVDGVLKLVTIDGKKYRFDVPKSAKPPATPPAA